MKTITTVASVDYLAQALASLTTAQRLYDDCKFVILLTTLRDVSYHNQVLKSRNIEVINLTTLAEFGNADPIIYKYSRDSLRWALKPSLMLYLLESNDSLIYVDNDIMFMGDWGWLWKEVENHDITLTPHHSPMMSRHPWCDGIFNAGFIGASRSGLDVINKWDDLCEWRCEINAEDGLYVDQKYLDVFPALCNCKIIKHRGCNVASWNSKNSIIRPAGDSFTVNGELLVFVHLSASAFATSLQSFRTQFAALVMAERQWLASVGLVTKAGQI
jgi:hypothetical protein